MRVLYASVCALGKRTFSTFVQASRPDDILPLPSSCIISKPAGLMGKSPKSAFFYPTEDNSDRCPNDIYRVNNYDFGRSRPTLHQLLVD
ncbi:hypothetical protein Tcan_03950 [Toxocara canis]|uniref:Uncharacterized protein n=1 Tax=Toxocara canis TaxID=6265 RepID=A0A0B2US26_TOXCA|nr:hypothetical protein Tcan_03950 [Toxocara canis]